MLFSMNYSNALTLLKSFQAALDTKCQPPALHHRMVQQHPVNNWRNLIPILFKKPDPVVQSHFNADKSVDDDS